MFLKIFQCSGQRSLTVPESSLTGSPISLSFSFLFLFGASWQAISINTSPWLGSFNNSIGNNATWKIASYNYGSHRNSRNGRRRAIGALYWMTVGPEWLFLLFWLPFKFTDCYCSWHRNRNIQRHRYKESDSNPQSQTGHACQKCQMAKSGICGPILAENVKCNVVILLDLMLQWVSVPNPFQLCSASFITLHGINFGAKRTQGLDSGIRKIEIPSTTYLWISCGNYELTLFGDACMLITILPTVFRGNHSLSVSSSQTSRPS